MSGFTDKDLWDWERHEQPKEKTIYKAKRSIHWRQPKLKCKTFRNNQVITKGEDRNGRLVFHYYMEGDPHNEHEFRVPEDNLPFIQDAIAEGILEYNKPLWVTIESDEHKHNRWIRIEEK